LNLNQYPDLTTMIRLIFLEVVIQSWLRKEPTLELGSGDHPMLRYYTQHIAQNVYKDCRMKRIKSLFKQAARHKKSWRCEEYMKKKINNIRLAS
jgi:hypothetical protein